MSPFFSNESLLGEDRATADRLESKGLLMHLPHELADNIETLLHRIPLTELQKSAEALSMQYRKKKEGQLISPLRSQGERLAYLVTRMPATYAVIERVLREVRRCLLCLEVQSLA